MAEITLHSETPETEEYVALRLLAGLSGFSPEAARAGLAGTWRSVTLRSNKQLVGMGRIIGDGGCFFQIVDIAVHPSFRKQGLGKRIVGALTTFLREEAPKSAYVSLIADGEAHRLYGQFGFKRTDPESWGMALTL